jgi:hypothetical protein
VTLKELEVALCARGVHKFTITIRQEDGNKAKAPRHWVGEALNKFGEPMGFAYGRHFEPLVRELLRRLDERNGEF